VVQHTDTILVVDDDSELSELMASILEDEGYQAVAVENGQVALDYLKKSPAPCVILLDLMMPSMNGWEFRDAQLSDPSLADIPVVVVSATANIARAHSAKSASRVGARATTPMSPVWSMSSYAMARIVPCPRFRVLRTRFA